MNLPKLSNEEIGCYHSKPNPSPGERKMEAGGMNVILNQIDQLEAIQAELRSISGQIKESVRMMSKSQ